MNLIAITLATFFLAYVFTEIDGPKGAFYKLRNKWEKPFGCFPCMAFISAVLVCLLAGFGGILMLAGAGGAVLLKNLSDTL